MSAPVRARLQFVVDTGEMPVAATAGPSGQIEHRGSYEEREVRLHDARGLRTSLDVEGFTLVSHPTQVSDFHDPSAVTSTYYPEVATLVRQTSGARRVEVFDHTIRSGDATEQASQSLREPIAVAHNDYTDASGLSRLRLAMPDEADALARERFAIVQVWRPTHDPIFSRPLALCDARTVRPQELLRTERRLRERVGYIYNLQYHPEQRWFWFPQMRRDEAVLFKVFDSDASKARFTPHGSPFVSSTPLDAPTRRSIEVRTLVFF